MEKNKILRKEIGELIKNKRMEYGYTQEGLAEAVGSSTNTIQNIETGKSYPSIQKAVLIELVLDIRISRLLIKAQINATTEFIDISKKFEYSIDEKRHEKIIQYKDNLDCLRNELSCKSYHYRLCLFYKAYITYISGDKRAAYQEFERCLKLKTKNTYLMDELNRRVLLKMLDCEMSMYQQKKIDNKIVEKICQRIYKNIYEKTNSYKIKYKALIKIIEMRVLIQKRYELGVKIAEKAKHLVIKNGDAFDNHCVMFYEGVCEYMNEVNKACAEIKISLALEFFVIKDQEEILRKYYRILKQLEIRLPDKT